VSDIVVVEAAEHVEDCVGLTDVGEELVAKTFTFGSTFDEACDVDDFDCSRDYVAWIDNVDKLVESLIWHCDYAHVWLDGTEWEIS
jgi:hypothetical protein